MVRSQNACLITGEPGSTPAGHRAVALPRLMVRLDRRSRGGDIGLARRTGDQRGRLPLWLARAFADARAVCMFLLHVKKSYWEKIASQTLYSCQSAEMYGTSRFSFK